MVLPVILLMQTLNSLSSPLLEDFNFKTEPYNQTIKNSVIPASPKATLTVNLSPGSALNLN